MFKKSFVSIYFLPDRLLILQLSSNKKRVTKHATVDLPSGIVENFRVVDEKALAQILSSIWGKFHLREKSVGLILPEFSTFTKFFKLPKLSIGELSEAVNWQAQEFLPAAPGEMITDWKIVDKTDTGYEILLLAVNRELLLGYVNAVEKAGLFPLVVETPSLCLVRLSGREEGNLIIYRNYGETLLIISQKEKIIGTSVTRNSSQDTLTKTAVRMLDHYKDVKVKKLFLGGAQVTEDLVKSLTDSLKLTPTWIKAEVNGMDDARIQEYLIPLSMQFVEPAEPMDPTSVNLLPGALVDRYRQSRLRLQFWSLTLTVTLFVWVCFLITLGAYLFMVQHINQLKANGQTGEGSQTRQEALKNIENINKTTDKILSIKKITVLPQKILNTIYHAKPQGVTVSKYSLNLEKGEISISGISADRASLLLFKQNLEANSDFTSVTIPISSFEKELNLEFQINFLFNPISSTQIKRKNT